MKRIALALAFIPFAAHAEVARLSDCDFIERDEWNFGRSIKCDVENLSTTAIAQLIYTVHLFTPGRAVPWHTSRYKLAAWIDGGIEPGEKVEVWFMGERLPERARSEVIAMDIAIVEAQDVNGKAIAP